MNHCQHACFRRLQHRLEERRIVYLQVALVGHEQLERGHAVADQRGNLVHHLAGQIGDGQVKAVVNVRFALGFLVPGG